MSLITLTDGRGARLQCDLQIGRKKLLNFSYVELKILTVNFIYLF